MNAIHFLVSYSTAGFVNLTSNTSVGCGKSDAQAGLMYTIYQMYIEEGNLNEDYFLATLASSMLLKEDIEKNGRIIDSGFVQVSRLTRLLTPYNVECVVKKSRCS